MGREGKGEKVSGVGKEEGGQVGWGREEGGMRGEWGRGEREEEISGGGQGEGAAGLEQQKATSVCWSTFVLCKVKDADGA